MVSVEERVCSGRGARGTSVNNPEEPEKTRRREMRKSRGQSGFIAAILLAAGLSVQVQAATYTYNTGGGQLWNAATNWVGGVVPTFNNEADLIFDSAIGVNNMRIVADRTVRSLFFGKDLTGANFNVISVDDVAANGTTARVLTFEANSGNASITVESGYQSNEVRIGATGGGGIVLNSSLDLNINQNVPVTFFRQVSGTGAINVNGVGIVDLLRLNTFSGGLNINSGSALVRGNNAAAGTGSIALGAVNGSASATLAAAGAAFANNITVNAGDGARTIRNDTIGLVPTLSGNITLNKNVSFDVANLGVDKDKLISTGVISGDFGVDKVGAGILQLDGINTYKGNTTISVGDLLLSDNAGLTFVIGGNGVNNKVTGAGNGTFGGDFYFDLTSAGTTVGDSWTIQDLAGTVSYAATFSVDGFSAAGGGLWTKNANGVDYQFSEGNGILTVIPEPATIGMVGLGALITLVIRRKMGR